MIARIYRSNLTSTVLVLFLVVAVAAGAGVAAEHKASATATRTITDIQRDTVPPTISCPVDTMFECDGIGDFGLATATDDVDPDPEISYSDTVVWYRCPYEYTFVRTWKATDASGNFSTCDQTVTIQDSTPPEIVCPGDVEIACDQWEDAGWAVFHDNCNPDPALLYEIVAVVDSTRWHNKIIRSWEVTDSCCNVVLCQQVVTLVDTIPPVLICAGNDTIPCDAPVVFPDPEAEDNCASAEQVTFEVVSLDTTPGPAGCEFTVTKCWVARDNYGNVSEPCCHSISVADCGGNTCTYTMGGWGSECPASQTGRPGSTQPGCIRDRYFDQVFSGGVMIGDTTGTNFGAVWTSSEAVEAYLPDGSTAGTLTEDLLNPTETPAGVLGGQILALTLNRGYSCAGMFEDLGIGDGACYGEYMIPDDCGLFAGLTVDELISIANQVIAGDIDALEPYGAAILDLVFAATCLNERFDECESAVWREIASTGVGVGSWLGPDDSADGTAEQRSLAGTDLREDVPAQGAGHGVRIRPNPVKGSAIIDFDVASAGPVKVDIYDVRGVKVATLVHAERPAGTQSIIWRGTGADGEPVARGVYFCRIQVGSSAPILEKLIKAE